MVQRSRRQNKNERLEGSGVRALKVRAVSLKGPLFNFGATVGSSEPLRWIPGAGLHTRQIEEGNK